MKNEEKWVEWQQWGPGCFRKAFRAGGTCSTTKRRWGLGPRPPGFLSLGDKTVQWNGFLKCILHMQASCPNTIPNACGSIVVGGEGAS